ncbi:hypothetical protein [Bradyrhizobium oligotrophicum]|uniref:hypothetical protein n=1 Tax=Bradyrhizobium oligotrophicum TaxID=44255 RepID=UPI003EB9002A
MYLTSIEASNRADWTVQVSATDADTGDAIDFTGASVTVAVRDENGCQKLLATTDNGKVTLPSAGVVQFAFTDSDMNGLCPATYLVGATYTINDETNQLFVGTVNVYDGVVAA